MTNYVRSFMFVLIAMSLVLAACGGAASTEAPPAVEPTTAPVEPTAAPATEAPVEDPLAMYLADVYTLPASLAGIAGISVPCAPTPAKGERPALPVGLHNSLGGNTTDDGLGQHTPDTAVWPRYVPARDRSEPPGDISPG